MQPRRSHKEGKEKGNVTLRGWEGTSNTSEGCKEPNRCEQSHFKTKTKFEVSSWINAFSMSISVSDITFLTIRAPHGFFKISLSHVFQTRCFKGHRPYSGLKLSFWKTSLKNIGVAGFLLWSHCRLCVRMCCMWFNEYDLSPLVSGIQVTRNRVHVQVASVLFRSLILGCFFDACSRFNVCFVLGLNFRSIVCDKASVQLPKGSNISIESLACGCVVSRFGILLFACSRLHFKTLWRGLGPGHVWLISLSPFGIWCHCRFWVVMCFDYHCVLVLSKHVSVGFQNWSRGWCSIFRSNTVAIICVLSCSSFLFHVCIAMI